MQNNDLIGKVVLSKAGRDSDHLYVIVRVIDNQYVLLANGNTKTFNNPKKKKLKHLNILEDVDDEIKLAIYDNDKSTDLRIRKFLNKKGIVKEG